MEVAQRRDIGSFNLIGESQDGVCAGNGNKIKMLEFFHAPSQWNERSLFLQAIYLYLTLITAHNRMLTMVERQFYSQEISLAKVLQ